MREGNEEGRCTRLYCCDMLEIKIKLVYTVRLLSENISDVQKFSENHPGQLSGLV
jgi:hypothetical protein